jgi:hypothetical protein
MGDVVPTRTSDDDDPVSELKRIRPEAAPAYELAYDEARRALDGQERALTAFRTRAGVVLSAAAITTSFLGGQALTKHGFTTLSWIAIGAFAVLGVATLCVLWPDHDWQFDAIPNQVISTYIEREDAVDVPLHAIHRDLALHMENSYSANESRRLRPLRWAFRIAVLALVAEVALWLAELATGR